MKKPIFIILIIYLLLPGSYKLYAKPDFPSNPSDTVKNYLSEKMNCLTTRKLDELDKYFPEKNLDARKYLFFTKTQLLRDYLVAYSTNNYCIKKVFPKVKIISVDTKENKSTVNALVTAQIHWNAQNSYSNVIVGVANEVHSIVLSQENNHWSILSDQFQSDSGSSELCERMSSENLIRSVNELKETANKALNRARSSPPTNLQLLPRQHSRERSSRELYNRDGAYNWAHKYWKNYSKEYINLGDQEWEGGDCTNFISQCLRAGGARNDTTGNNKWYYIPSGGANSNKDNYSWTWSTAKGLNSVLLGNNTKKEFGPKGTEKIITGDSNYSPALGDFISLGDIIQYEWSAGSGIKHSAIIVGMVNNSALQRNEPVISTHSFDSWNLPWTKNAYKTHFIHITGVN